MMKKIKGSISPGMKPKGVVAPHGKPKGAIAPHGRRAAVNPYGKKRK